MGEWLIKSAPQLPKMIPWQAKREEREGREESEERERERERENGGADN